MRDRRTLLVAVVLIVAVGLVAARLIGGVGPGSLLLLDGSGSKSPESDTAQSGGRKDARGASATATPVSVDSLDQASTQKDPFILLNPGTATSGSAVGVSGSGFDPGSAIDLYISSDPNDGNKYQELGFAQADSGGSFGSFSFTVPANYRNPTFTVIARQRKASRQATATGRLEALRPSVKLGTNVGSVGDQVQLSAQGFMPNEEVKVYFNGLASDPVQTYKASPGGTLDKQTVRIPYGAAGNNTLIFVGSESQAPVTAPFLMLTLYPNVSLSSYATKADTAVAFSGSGFGPDEDVNVHLNNPQAPPIAKVKTSSTGTFENGGGVVIPFELTGKNTLIFVGEKSQATATAGFDVLPYTPNIQPSTYGGRPGTTITFYGDGFAREEVVRIYVDRSRDSAGKQVSCAQADDQGRIGAGGSYTIPPNAQVGKQDFTAIGTRSKSSAAATVEVMDAGVPIQTPPDTIQADFQCPFDNLENSQLPPPTPQAAPPAPAPRQPGTPQPQAAPQSQGTAAPRGTSTPVPTARPQPTNTQVPTARPQPTNTPRPANTPPPAGRT